MTQDPRQLAFLTLRSIDRGAFADVALDKTLRQAGLNTLDRRLLTELVYGTVRRQRTLDFWIDQLATKPARQQPPDLRLILHLGLYQLRFLSQIPSSAAVNTTVDLAKRNGFSGLAGFVNGLLRRSIRESGEVEAALAHPITPAPSTAGFQAVLAEPATVATTLVATTLGIQHSFPDWIVQVWLDQLGVEETAQLCEWMNQAPHIDLRVNPLRATIDQVESAMQAAGIAVDRLPHLPQALRLRESHAVQPLPGFEEGWWMVQDGSAQLVSYLVDPQPEQVVADACAAPGGKALHLAELMHDRGTVWACDRAASRLKKLQQNIERLGLRAVRLHIGDSREFKELVGQCDRVLLDAPCSGLGTLHRHADARWRQTPDSVRELTVLQQELLEQTSQWVKPGGFLVYATCTLHPAENEDRIRHFIAQHPDWTIVPPALNSPASAFATPEGWVKVWSHRHQMDGFFVARLKKH